MGLRDGSQAAITALSDKLRGIPRAVLQLVVKIIVTVFTATITCYSFRMVADQIVTGQTSPGLHLPMAVPYAALLVSFGIMTLVQGASLIHMIRHFKEAAHVGSECGEEGGMEV